VIYGVIVMIILCVLEYLAKPKDKKSKKDARKEDFRK